MKVGGIILLVVGLFNLIAGIVMSYDLKFADGAGLKFTIGIVCIASSVYLLNRASAIKEKEN